ATEDLYRRPLHPYTQGLLDSVPRLGQNKADIKLSSMPGHIPALDALPPACIFSPRCPLALERCLKVRPSLEFAPVGSQGRRIRCHRWREIHQGRVSPRRAAPAASKSIPPQRDAGTVLAVQDVEKHYPIRASLGELLRGRRAPALRAVDGVSLEIERGRTLGLVGESGSGKTTLARAIIGLVGSTGGSMELLGIPLPRKLSARRLETLRRLQIVFQNPEEALNPYLSIGEALR
ncbi:MAG: ATP-binding cassette domain-containing protein, partial [Anaerolineae bacterium]|nr:ATP-binding cassette domain-containing protein [Anaerolineae bacterium]